MKNITVTVPDDVYRRARIEAAEQGRSVSSLVAEFLQRLSRPEAELRSPRGIRDEVAVYNKSDGETRVAGARAALIERLSKERAVEARRWTREELYEEQS
jgi:hypothetical protein